MAKGAEPIFPTKTAEIISSLSLNDLGVEVVSFDADCAGFETGQVNLTPSAIADVKVWLIRLLVVLLPLVPVTPIIGLGQRLKKSCVFEVN